jgi:hypothetical protein
VAGLLRSRNSVQNTRDDTAGDIGDTFPYVYYPPPVSPPATSYADISSPLTSQTGPNIGYSTPLNAAIVNRHSSKDGIENDYIYGGYAEPYQHPYLPPTSSRFQQTLVRLVAYSLNTKWYIAYPAATVMNGGKRNQGLTFKTPQLNTRTSGGPGQAVMGPRPTFNRVQRIPRYNSSPGTYNTRSTAN